MAPTLVMIHLLNKIKLSRFEPNVTCGVKRVDHLIKLMRGKRAWELCNTIVNMILESIRNRVIIFQHS